MADTQGHVVALLLSGGGGTRLWPVSTEAEPKQFLKLFGERSLFQGTAERLAAADVAEIVVITNAAHDALVTSQVRELGLPAPHLVLEPVRRDSGPAVAAGIASIIERHGDDVTVVVLPCDHLIPDHAAFAATLARAVGLARQGWLTTFGIHPASPSTEYGYIQQGGAIPDADGGFVVERFHEKPALEKALAYVAGGNFHWNSGMFVFGAASFAREAAEHMPDVWRAAREAVRTGAHGDRRLMLGADAFAAAPRISIDYGLMEKSRKVGMVPASFAWSDVGNWASVHENHERDAAGNVVIGDAVASDSRGTLVMGENTRVVVIGMSDVVVVASPSGVLVAPKARAADIKGLIGR